MGETEDERGSQANQLFEIFVQASTCKGTLQAFSVLCRQLDLLPAHHPGFYSSLKAAITSWKAKALWTKLDKRANHKEYKKGKACADIRCLVIGAGPCGLRTAIELALLGAKVVVIEKRDTFSRNNVLHLWPYTIHDLRNLGAKKFYGKFCAGAIDHISIRQLQLILLKVCLILGVEVHVNVEFLKLQEPTEEQDNHGHGWRAEISPPGQPIANYEFDVLIGSDGRRSTLDGFRRKEFRGKLAIAITANFVNRNTTAEAKVEEISGVAFIFNQKFFLELKEETGIDLENIVYYKDNTHYFVMTAKKQSLLDKGVIIHDYIETERLLHTDNVNQEALLSYAREAADFGTNYQLPSLDYAINHYSQPDVAMFDFTCMYASENAALIRQKSGRQLLVALVGDSLLEPFWPMGTGCARGFLAAFDTAWMVKGWAQGKAPLELLSERESIYRLLPQTTAENITKNFDQYTIDPATRYPNLNSSCVRPQQVRHLYINGEQTSVSLEHGGPSHRSVSTSRKGSEVRSSRLLLWCQKQTQGYRSVDVTDLTTSWRSGLALCALIHRQRPDLIDFDSLNEADSAKNNQLAFEVAEQAFGIQPLITGKEMAAEQEPDKLVMVLYLSKFYELLCHSALPVSVATQGTDENNEDYSSKSTASVYNLMNLALPRKRIPKDDKKLEDDDLNKKRRKGCNYLEELSYQSAPFAREGGEQKENKVRSMATQLQAKFEENAPSSAVRRQACGSAAPVCVPAKPQVVHSHTGRSALSCLLSPFPPAQSKQCNGHPESQQAGAHRHSDRAEIKRIECLDPSKQRTVGKVSSVIGVKAATLAILYETDHRPNNPVTLSLQVNPRKEFAPGVGGSDTCHFCKKRVYIMERLSAEGCFFHRECFRCEVCSTTLRLGGHMFDSDHGTFYCKLHFSQQKKSQRHKKTETHAGSVSSPDGSGGYSAMSSLQSQPPDTLGLNSVTEPQPSLDQNHMLDPSTDPSKVVESPTEQELSEGPAPTDTSRPVDSSLQEASTASEPLKPNSLQPNKVAHSNAKGGFSNRTISWKRKIKTTLPLILVKTFDHNQLTEDNSVLIEEDSDFEEIHAPETIAKPEKLSAASQHPLQEEQDQPTLATFARYRPHGILATLTPSYLCPEKPCNYTTPSLEKLPNYTMPLLEKPPNYMTTSLEKPPNYAAPSLEKPPNYMTPSLERPPNCTTPSFEKPPKNTTPSLENPPNYIASSLEKAPNYTIPSLEKPPNYMTPSIEKPPSDMSLFLEKQTSLTPKKKLMLSSSEKDRLLNWDIATPGRFSSAPVVTDEAEGDIQRRRRPENTTQPQNDAVAFAEPSSVPPEPSRNSLLSGFQLWASTLRRSLSGAENNSRSVKRIRPHRARPWSEGSLFGSTSQTREEAEGGSSRAATEGNPLSVKKRSEITTMLEQVTLSAKPPGNSKDDMASLPRRKLNFFSSLRLKRNEVRDRSETDDQTKDILAILSKFRSKDSTQLQQKEEEENYSTDEEDLELDRHRSDAGGSKSRSRKQEELLVLQTKRDQLKRLHRAQVIQRQLEEVEEKQRALEEEGVALEKLLRGENTEPCEDEAGLQQTWFNLVLEKNRLARYESELMIFAQELELEDRQSQLQQDLRHRMAIEDCEKSAGELVEEQALLVEVMKVVEERDQLVGLLEEQRLQERAEDRDLESLILSKGYQFHWA
ncbi:protein-methionine sulfoxide oxidase mical2b isoform X5 [Electrophorus electricus]|uniref:protein-methionine sulfoxide oxidase mical2b isoform X5 n=1 Tax=Electrophorus electricus TaxID=8005 RepID=UPI0015D01792|nr:protein-methionine sulfoxide oxidase mical2b isoform X5 [Electrophorus electricus]